MAQGGDCMVANHSKTRLLVVAPHCDDEILGCGGYMAKVAKRGGLVHVVVASTSDIHFLHLDQVVTVDQRKEELKNALGVLGVQSHELLTTGYESKMETFPSGEMVGMLDRIQEEFQPTIILLPLPSFHQDHQYMWNICIAATRPSPAKHNPNLIAAYEYPAQCWGDSSAFDAGKGGIYVDIDKELSKKADALSKYVTQMREDNHLISIEGARALARLRGLESGYKHAELFHCLRMRLG